MSKSELTFTDEGTEAYRRMVEGIVREHFTALDTTGSEEEGGDGSQRDAAEYDLKDRMDLEELEAALKQVDKLLEGFWYIAEASNPVALMVVSDSRERARVALERVREFRATWGQVNRAGRGILTLGAPAFHLGLISGDSVSDQPIDT